MIPRGMSLLEIDYPHNLSPYILQFILYFPLVLKRNSTEVMNVSCLFQFIARTLCDDQSYISLAADFLNYVY